jgi:hypothetical protein
MNLDGLAVHPAHVLPPTRFLDAFGPGVTGFVAAAREEDGQYHAYLQPAPKRVAAPTIEY